MKYITEEISSNLEETLSYEDRRSRINFEAIVQASSLPLSIVLVGVGDGPWDIMEDFDDNLPARKFDNFQFVNFHSALKDAKNPEASVALASLMEVPSQYQTMLEMGYFSKCSAMENKL